MKHWLGWARRLVFLGLCLSLHGCSGCNTKPPGKGIANKPVAPLDQTARDEYYGATDADRFRRANGLANRLFANQTASLNPHQPGAKDRAKLLALVPDAGQLGDAELYRKFLGSFVGLSDDEIEEVESGSFTQLDGQYLEGCQLLQEIVRAMKLQSMSDLGKAEYCFQWVCRQILLFEGRPGMLPPQFVLQAGEGNSAERTFLLIELLRQAQLDACAIGVPGKDGEIRPWLAGVLVGGPDTPEIYLFDPRLDRPLPGPDGKGIATLEQLKANPKLLDAFKVPQADLVYDVDAAMIEKAEILLALPLSALSARMRYLDDDLLFGHSVTRCSIRAGAVAEKFAKLNLAPVRSWGAVPAMKGHVRVSPARSLRAFLPPDEGGTDKSLRWFEFNQRLVPEAPFIQWYSENRLALRDVTSPVIMIGLIKPPMKLWENFVLEPAHKLLRGRFEDCTQRLDFIEKTLENLQQPDEAEIRDWVRNARAKFANEPKIADAAVFDTDQWLRTAQRQPDDLIGAYKGGSRSSSEGKTVLTTIVLNAARLPLNLERSRLFAMEWQEKGAALLAQKKPADDAWENAEFHWGHATMERDNPSSGQGLQDRWKAVLGFLQPGQKKATAAGLFTYYECMLRKSANGRLQRVEMLERMAKLEPAKHGRAMKEAERLALDLENVAGDKELAAVRQKFKDEPVLELSVKDRKELTIPAFFDRLLPDAREQVDVAFADMGSGGTLHWQRYAAALLLEQLKRAP
jgi:hypothetical protein